MDLTRFQLIDENDKYLVFGFIRNVQNKLFPNTIAYYNIPNAIYGICCLFYSKFDDEWDKNFTSKNLQINGNGKILKQIKYEKWDTAFLKNIV